MPIRVVTGEIADEVVTNFNRTDHINLIARETIKDRLLDPVENQFRPLDIRFLQLPVLQQLSVGVNPRDVGEEGVEVKASHPVVILRTHVEGDARHVDVAVV